MKSLAELYGLRPVELADILGGTGRAKNVWALVRQGVDPFEPGHMGERTFRRLTERCIGTTARVVDRTVATCGTIKLLIQLHDDRTIETVVIPGRGRTTVCVSTQIGCGRGCAFCVTATMGLLRSLSAAEIVMQVVLAAGWVRASNMPRLRNVVYMGMGEPLDNIEATHRSIDVLIDPHALAVPKNHVTVSTIGPSPGAIRATRDLPGFLAWSLHAADDAIRRRMIPTCKHPIADLRDAFLDVIRYRNDILFVEVTLVAGLNDGDEHATALCELLRPFHPDVRVNLLPMNPGREGLTPSTEARTEAFQQILRDRDFFCATRHPRGSDANAACGQLASR